jgi:hypothetical protein
MFGKWIIGTNQINLYDAKQICPRLCDNWIMLRIKLYPTTVPLAALNRQEVISPFITALFQNVKHVWKSYCLRHEGACYLLLLSRWSRMDKKLLICSDVIVMMVTVTPLRFTPLTAATIWGLWTWHWPHHIISMFRTQLQTFRFSLQFVQRVLTAGLLCTVALARLGTWGFRRETTLFKK